MLGTRSTSHFDITQAKTPGRAGPARSATLRENLIHKNGAMTVDVKSRKAGKTPLVPHTLRPFKDTSKPGGPSKLFTAGASVIRPLHDKTPAANRTANATLFTPGPHPSTKPQNLVFQLPATETPGLLRPSSTRKSVRIPRSASRSFETPKTRGGNHWDVSDGSIEIPEAPVLEESIQEEDHDEVEYAPPRPPEIPYDPGFDLPNYAEVGARLRRLLFVQPIYDDAEPPEMTTEFYPYLFDWKRLTARESEEEEAAPKPSRFSRPTAASSRRAGEAKASTMRPIVVALGTNARPEKGALRSTTTASKFSSQRSAGPSNSFRTKMAAAAGRAPSASQPLPDAKKSVSLRGHQNRKPVLQTLPFDARVMKFSMGDCLFDV